jgi:hypothetical protein
MIMLSLLKQFLDQDCDAGVRQKLLTEINKHSTVKTDVVREFNFNRFNVHLDFRNGSARIEDELDKSEAGSCMVPIADFSSALNEHRPQR